MTAALDQMAAILRAHSFRDDAHAALILLQAGFAARLIAELLTDAMEAAK